MNALTHLGAERLSFLFFALVIVSTFIL